VFCDKAGGGLDTGGAAAGSAGDSGGLDEEIA
jgi:hypothetical protein